MTPTEIESIIFEALQARLQTLVLSPVLPVAWPGAPFERPADNNFLRVQYLPNETDRLFIESDGPHRHYGILQVTVVSDADGGVLGPREIAGKIATHFKADTKMIYDGIMVRSMKRPSVGPSYPDVKVTSDMLTPVTVEYETYV